MVCAVSIDMISQSLTGGFHADRFPLELAEASAPLSRPRHDDRRRELSPLAF